MMTVSKLKKFQVFSAADHCSRVRPDLHVPVERDESPETASVELEQDLDEKERQEDPLVVGLVAEKDDKDDVQEDEQVEDELKYPFEEDEEREKPQRSSNRC